MTTVNEYTTTTLDGYLSIIKEIQSELADGSKMPHLWYRGHSDVTWDLIPAIQRNLNTDCAESFFEKERGMNNDFQSRASIFFETKPSLNDFSNWLTLMQHYGFPTRLLDWTRSPLFALYFSTQSFSDCNDACIWILHPGLLNRFANLEHSGGTYLYHMEHNVIRELIYPAFKRVTDNYKERLYQERHASKELDENCINWYDDKFGNKVVGCYATQRDMRVFNQQSVFTVHNTLKKLVDIQTEIRPSGDNMKDSLLFKLIVPAQYKKNMFDDLYNSGITHSVVFPDLQHVGLDVLHLYGI
jgi:hypothetical protein